MDNFKMNVPGTVEYVSTHKNKIKLFHVYE